VAVAEAGARVAAGAEVVVSVAEAREAVAALVEVLVEAVTSVVEAREAVGNTDDMN